MNTAEGAYLAPQSVLVTLALIGAGTALWKRRTRWRDNYQNAIYLSLLLQVLAFTLSAPQFSRAVGNYQYMITRTAHLQNFLGHVCFISAIGAVIYAAANRLVPQQQVNMVMTRVDRPAAVVATTMLICITLSRSTRQRSYEDFFDVPVDGWLAIYWITYGALILYLLLYLVRLMWELRSDPRSRISAHIYLVASAAGIVGIVFAVIVALSLPSFLNRNFDSVLWVFLVVPSVLASAAAAWQWYSRHSFANLQWYADSLKAGESGDDADTGPIPQARA